MSGQVIIIPADITAEVIARNTDEQPTAAEIHKTVDGYFELVPHWNDHGGLPCVVYCNEDGKRLGLPINDRATALWWSILGRPVDDVLVGNVVLVINLPDTDEEEDA